MKHNAFSGKHSVGTTGRNDERFSHYFEKGRVKRSTFQRNHIHKTMYNAGRLVPILIDEILPGDVFEVNLSHVTRLVTPIFPVMDEIELDFYFFFVPNRISWFLTSTNGGLVSGWQRFMGEAPDNSWAPVTVPSRVPRLSANAVNATEGTQVRSIMDYYGIPVGQSFLIGTVDINALPFRQYILIWNRWFRDQNLQAPIAVFLGDGDNTLSTGFGQMNGSNILIHTSDSVLPVCKKHDYFTSCLPFSARTPSSLLSGSASPILWMTGTQTQTMSASQIANQMQVLGTYSGALTTANNQNIVQTLRNAFQLNKHMERAARGGSRYIEIIRAHWGVDAQDYRMQYPEFLGSHHCKIGFNQVPQTSSTDSISPQGNMAAYSLSAEHNRHVFKKTFVEHGFLHGFVVARQRKTYQDGTERFWMRGASKYDYYFPEFDSITEQPVYLWEVSKSGLAGCSARFQFGIQEAWADYRYKPNRVSGNFRTSSLMNPFPSFDAWHFADNQSTTVANGLTSAFIQDNSQENIARTLAVSADVSPQILSDIRVEMKCHRMMSVRSIPGHADHF